MPPSTPRFPLFALIIGWVIAIRLDVSPFTTAVLATGWVVAVVAVAISTGKRPR